MKRGNYEGGPSPGAAPAAKKLHRGDKFEGKLNYIMLLLLHNLKANILA